VKKNRRKNWIKKRCYISWLS